MSSKGGIEKEFANCFVDRSFGYTKPDNLPIVNGTIFGMPVNFLRDTGCTTVLVKREFVLDVQ